MDMTDTKALAEELAAALGGGRVTCDTDILEKYARDETSDLSAKPDLVVRAKSTEEVSAVLRICSRRRVPVIPRGAGTGVTGGAIPVAGGVVLSLEGMNRIIEIDRKNMVAVVEPGVITGDLQRAALEQGLMYPPDPSSLESCSLGGNIAEMAGGPRAVKYGTTKDYVLGLEFVLADGSIISTGGKYVKNATGYNITGIIIGSEGTLAVVTKILLRLVPAATHVIDLLIPYSRLEDAVDDVYAIIAARIVPAALEFMEEDALRLTARYLKSDLPFPEARAHLLVQLDGTSEDALQNDLERLVAVIGRDQERIIVAETKMQRDRVWKARRAIREAITAESPVFLAEDTVVPRSEIPAFLKEVKSLLNGRDLRSIMFGHAGDGNVHIDVLKGERPDSEWAAMVPGLKKELYAVAISHGGTITGEHGIGYTRREYLGMAMSREEIELMRRIKSAFDPDSILNPHKIFQV